MARQEVTARFKVDKRYVEVKAFDAIGVEDCYNMLLRGVLHRVATGEDWISPIPREVKDFMIRTNLNI